MATAADLRYDLLLQATEAGEAKGVAQDRKRLLSVAEHSQYDHGTGQRSERTFAAASTARLAEGIVLAIDIIDLTTYLAPFSLQEVRNGTFQRTVQNKMRTPGFAGEVAALHLMLALGAGFDPVKAMGNGVIDRLIVTGLEVQEAVIFTATPIAAIENPAAREIKRAGNGPSLAPGHDQHYLVRHGFANRVEEV